MRSIANGKNRMWTVEFAAAAEDDFGLIFEHLAQVYRDLGDDPDVAFDRAEQRLNGILATARTLANVPFQGTLTPDIGEGLRFVRKDKAVFWFVADETRQIVQVLAVFFGGQDHTRHMLARLLAGPTE